MAISKLICHENRVIVSSTAIKSSPAAKPLTIKSRLRFASVKSVPKALIRKSLCIDENIVHGRRTAFRVIQCSNQGGGVW